MSDDKPHRERAVVDRGDAIDLNHQNHDIFFAAVETTRMPMIVTDPRQPDNPIIFANRAFLEMTGYGLSEIVGNNCRFLQGPDTDRDTVAANCGQSPRPDSQAGLGRETTLALHRDGRPQRREDAERAQQRIDCARQGARVGERGVARRDRRSRRTRARRRATRRTHFIQAGKTDGAIGVLDERRVVTNREGLCRLWDCCG